MTSKKGKHVDEEEVKSEVDPEVEAAAGDPGAGDAGESESDQPEGELVHKRHCTNCHHAEIEHQPTMPISSFYTGPVLVLCTVESCPCQVTIPGEGSTDVQPFA